MSKETNELTIYTNVETSQYFTDNSYNPGQNIWHKVKKYGKIGQDFKNVISNFACFLTAIVNV